MTKHEVVDLNGKYAIKLLNNQFDGILVSLGKVAFHEEGDQCRMSFDYDILDDNDQVYTEEELTQELGDLIIEMIGQGIEKNDLVYTGGIDDNRENDPLEPDSQ